MTAEAQTWHYGIIAQWWAEFNTGGDDIARFQAIIEQSGKPALDAACGTGRLLIPFLRAGLDVDGCDISGDMLDFCREKAAREGFAPNLYRQALHELELPRRYQTIIACGSIGIGGERAFDQEAFRRFYAHLEPGGTFAFDAEMPYSDTERWSLWLPGGRAHLPEPPDRAEEIDPETDARLTSDGSRITLGFRRIALDPLEQRLTMALTGFRWRDGLLVEQHEHVMQACLYFKNELLMMLEQAGFRDSTVTDAISGDPPTAESATLLFTARK